MTLDDLLALQRERDAAHVHLAYVGDTGIHLAHTDEERAAGGDLYDCPVHAWLEEADAAPAPTGVYVVHPHMVDADSESYPVPSYDLLPLELADLEGFREAA